jgi:DNA-binding HxlR family transcriptional regulator
MRIDECPVRATANVIGGKWKPLILHSLKAGARHYGELQRTIPDAPKKVLTDQLRELEQDGIVLRKVHGQKAPRVAYSLTSYGRTLAPILRLMAAWGERHKRVRLQSVERLATKGW